MIVINTKNYKRGKELVDLVKKIEIYYNKAIVAVNPVELMQVASSTNLEVYSQNVDSESELASTGKIIAESLVEAGAKGSIINHSENKISLSEIRKRVKRCNEAGLKTIVCAASLKEAQEIVKIKPDAIAFEDSKLISTGKSITSLKTKEVEKFVEMLEGTEIIPLCGAGISSPEDVASALVLGCKGVLIASAIANNQNCEKFLKELSSLL